MAEENNSDKVFKDAIRQKIASNIVRKMHEFRSYFNVDTSFEVSTNKELDTFNVFSVKVTNAIDNRPFSLGLCFDVEKDESRKLEVILTWILQASGKDIRNKVEFKASKEKEKQIKEFISSDTSFETNINKNKISITSNLTKDSIDLLSYNSSSETNILAIETLFALVLASLGKTITTSDKMTINNYGCVKMIGNTPVPQSALAEVN